MNIQIYQDDSHYLIDIITNQVVTPLRNFEWVVYDIDAIHKDAYDKFINNIEALFAGNPPPMEGGGSDALFQKMGDYYYAERLSFGYGDGTQSQLISMASFFCKKAAEKINDLIGIVPNHGDLITMIVTTAVADDVPLPVRPSELTITRHLSTPDTIYWIYPEQLAIFELMGIERDTWSYKMRDLLRDNSLEPLLPEPPNNLPIAFVKLPPVTLTDVQKQQVNDVMTVLASLGLSNIPQQYIEVLISEGFSVQDILAAVQDWQAAGKTPQQISDLLYLSAFHILLGPYYRSDMVPLGMTPQQYQQFVSTMRSGLSSLGYCVGAGIGGSAVTGNKYTTGRPFDGNPDDPSDYDVALGDANLLATCKALGIKLRDGNTHTGPLTDDELKKLGLYNLEQQLQQETGREVHFMIYNSLTATSARAPYIYQFSNSCNKV